MGRTSVALTRPGEPVACEADRIRARPGRAAYSSYRLSHGRGGCLFRHLEPRRCLHRSQAASLAFGRASLRGAASGLPHAFLSSARPASGSWRRLSKRWDAPETYALAAPAGMNAVYCQILARGCKALSDIVALPQSECAVLPRRQSGGLGRARCRGSLSDAGFVSLPVTAPELHPDAVTLAELAMSLDPERDAPSPYYVREADAKPQTKHVIALETD